jgi:predicted lipid-binding transport protein (Tim44 family)
MKRRALILFAVLLLALALAPEALAAAGGGSGGFGGGGGGGGRGLALYILIQILIRIAIFGHGIGAIVLVALIILAMLVLHTTPHAGRWFAAQQAAGPAARRRTRRRERRVELAAAEAAEDEPAFAPANVRDQVASLFQQVQAAWDAGDRSRLRHLVAPDLLAEWERRLDDFDRRGWRNRVELLGPPRVEYVSLQHRGGLSGDRVTCRIEAKLRDHVVDGRGNRMKRSGRLGETVRVREFWTLARRGSRWMLQSVEQGAEGAHAMDEQLVPTPWADERSIRDQALVEGALADAVPGGTQIAELASVSFEGGARAAALDLSLVDGRFAPDVLEVAARRAVEAWADAVDGDDGALLELARRDAARQLLHPGDPSGRTRLVLRGPRVEQIRIMRLDPRAEPPTMTIEVEIVGSRYLEDRDTAAVLTGNKSRETRFTERWTLALDGDNRNPWRIVAVGSPLAGG